MDRDRLAPETIVDIESALQRLGGDEDLLADMIGFFIEDAPHLLKSLQTAIDAREGPAARKAAHSLKGLILGSGGVRAARIAQAVEDAAHAANWGEIEPLVDSLTTELWTLIEATSSYREQRTARTQGAPPTDVQRRSAHGFSS